MDDATFVLINPIGNDAACWDFLHLDRPFAPFEYPGHGRRARQPGWTHQSFADEIVAHFDGPLDLLGMSMGAAVVMHVLVRHPERVRSAIIACNGSLARSADTEEARERHREVLFARGRVALEGGMEAVIPDTMDRWFSPYARLLDHRGYAYCEQRLRAMDPEAWNDIWNAQANSGHIPIEQVAAVKQPVTIIGGTHDRAASLKSLDKVHALIERSRYEVIAGTHMLHVDQPDSVRAAIERHFAWLPVAQRVEQPLGSFAWTRNTGTVEAA